MRTLAYLLMVPYELEKTTTTSIKVTSTDHISHLYIVSFCFALWQCVVSVVDIAVVVNRHIKIPLRFLCSPLPPKWRMIMQRNVGLPVRPSVCLSLYHSLVFV